VNDEFRLRFHKHLRGWYLVLACENHLATASAIFAFDLTCCDTEPTLLALRGFASRGQSSIVNPIVGSYSTSSGACSQAFQLMRR